MGNLDVLRSYTMDRERKKIARDDQLMVRWLGGKGCSMSVAGNWTDLI